METEEKDGRAEPGLVRSARIALGVLWIIDAALQAQPRMFGRELVTDMILPAGSGQPAPVAWPITSLGHLILPDPAVWNALFVLVQLVIGVALLRRATARVGLIGTMVWSLAVWWLGEGFGMLLTGTASPFTGAPGAALLYGAVAVVLWPATGPGAGAGWDLGTRARVAWAAFWGLSAVLWVMPANRSTGSFHAALQQTAGGQPRWYASFLHSAAGHISGQGPGLAVLLALFCLAVGVAPLVLRRPWPFVVAGLALQAVMWFTGEGLGSVLTGMGTDVSTAPVVWLLAAIVLVAVTAPDRVPRLLAAGGALGLRLRAGAGLTGLALVVVGTYPTASAEAAGTSGHASKAMGSMSTMGQSDRSSGVAPGGTSSGLMAGMASPDQGWTYVGPPLPAGETRLLDVVYEATEKGHAMQTPTCTAAPTATEAYAAADLVQRTTAAVARYRDISAAKADGYVAVTSPAYPVVHYVKAANMGGPFVLDPDHVQSLVYAHTPQGWVLAAAMFLMPSAGTPGPMPGGCLTQWHAHTNLCTSIATHVISGFAPCPPGMVQTPTPEMLHVWQVPVPGGALAMDPSDLQVVEAAIEAQESGDAPVGVTG
ncbi:MAG TPA: hypothetical protein VFP54_12835 [Acidimicrobiales bacterium]|nr:hypothetical protein [Acidimicrobiales bacterium]